MIGAGNQVRTGDLYLGKVLVTLKISCAGSPCTDDTDRALFNGSTWSFLAAVISGSSEQHTFFMFLNEWVCQSVHLGVSLDPTSDRVFS